MGGRSSHRFRQRIKQNIDLESIFLNSSKSVLFPIFLISIVSNSVHDQKLKDSFEYDFERIYRLEKDLLQMELLKANANLKSDLQIKKGFNFEKAFSIKLFFDAFQVFCIKLSQCILHGTNIFQCQNRCETGMQFELSTLTENNSVPVT